MGSRYSGAEALRTVPRGDAIPLKDVKEMMPHFLEHLQAVMFDCDGVLWMGMEPFAGAQELVIKLRLMGKKVFFLTNNSTKTREEFLEKFNRLGFQTTIEEIVGTAYLTALYLKEQDFKGKVYVIGTPGITGELDKVGIPYLPIGPDPVPLHLYSWGTSSLQPPALDAEVGAVVVGFDHHLSFMKMVKAASYLKDPNCLFVATNTDERFPSGPQLVIPGTGSMVNAVKTAADREPKIMGKPSTYPFEFVRRSHDLDPSRVLMVGDRANTDIIFGNNCGLWTLLVLTGVTTMAEVNDWKASDDLLNKKLIPDFCLSDVQNLLALIQETEQLVPQTN